jgi:hypothetical protein
MEQASGIFSAEFAEFVMGDFAAAIPSTEIYL